MQQQQTQHSTISSLRTGIDTTLDVYRDALVPTDSGLMLDPAKLREPANIGHSALFLLAIVGNMRLKDADDGQRQDWMPILEGLVLGILSMQRAEDGAFGVEFGNDDVYKGGWAGQGLLVNPSRDTVAVFASYFKDDQYSEVRLEAKVFEVMDGVFGKGAPD